MPAVVHLVHSGGPGSFGDEAMESAIESAARARGLEVRRYPSTFLQKWADPTYTHWAQERLVRRVVPGRDRVVVVGADVLDGGYDLRRSLLRWRLVHHVAAKGVEVGVSGFSMRADTPAPIREAMRRLPTTATLFARDPLTLQRCSDWGIATQPSSDIAFAAPLPVAERRDPDRIGFSLRAEQLEASLRNVVASTASDALRKGRRIRLILHDARPARRGGGDHEVHRRLAKAISGLVEVVEARGYADAWTAASGCGLVVSGRMHLLIGASRLGSAVAGLDYQDKMDGMLRSMGVTKGTIPARAEPETLERFITEAIGRPQAFQPTQVAHLERLAVRQVGLLVEGPP